MAADPTPPQPGPNPDRIDDGMLGLGANLGAEIWWCQQLFALSGGWVPTTGEARVRLHWAELSRVLGDHAGTLTALLPRPAPVDPHGWVSAPSPGVVGLVSAIAAESASISRLGALHRVVVPRLIVAWSRDTGLTGAAIRRPLGHARRDLVELWAEGEALIGALLADRSATVADLAATTLRVETDLVAAGGLHPSRPYELPA